jgi:hypothetical protein
MDPKEIIQASVEIAKSGATIGAVIPFTALVKRMLGPASDEIAERIRDEIRIYRYGRQLSLLQKAEKMAMKAGYTPKAVSPKLLFSLLEGASLEENEDLHDMWAALLANAASPKMDENVRPSFLDTMKLLTPDTAHFLNALYKRASHGLPAPVTQNEASAAISDLSPRELTLIDLGTFDTLFELFGQTGHTSLPAGTIVTSGSSVEELAMDEVDRYRFAVIMDELARFQMFGVTSGRNSGDHFYLSAYAAQFITACQVPGEPASE